MPQERTSGFEFRNPEPREGDLYFLGIGIDAYQKAPMLSSAVRDVQAMCDMLTKQFMFDNATLLLNDEATRDQILSRLHEYTKTLRNEDSLLVYFSGLSWIEPDSDEGFLFPVKGERDKKSTLISNRELGLLFESMKCRHVLFICDAQVSKHFFSSHSFSGLEEKAAAISNTRSRMALVAGVNNSPVSDGIAGSGGPFTIALIQTLENTETSTTFDEIFSRIDWKDFLSESKPLYGPIYGAGHRGGSFFFSLRPHEATKPPEPGRAQLSSFWKAVQSFYEDTPVSEAFAKSGDLMSGTDDLPTVFSDQYTIIPSDHLSLVVDPTAWQAIETALGKRR